MRDLGLAVACIVALTSSISAQTYPNRPVTLVVNSEAGGPVDFAARAIKDELSLALGQTVVIENRSGAGGQVGAASVMRSTPDGYTLLISSPGPFVIAPLLYSNLGYDPLRDFEPVTRLASVPAVFAISIAMPATTLSEFIALAKTQPGKLNFGSGGIATPAHLGSEMLKLLAGIDLVHIPFRGTPQALTALLTNEIALFVSGPAAVVPQADAGKIRLVAVTGEHRMKTAPNVPTAKEIGMPDLDVPSFYGMYAPKGTPKPVIETINAAVTKALENPKVRAHFESSAYFPIGDGPDAFREYLNKDIEKWRGVIQKSGIKVE